MDSAYSALDPAFFPGRNSNGTSVGGVPTAPLSIPCYCGSSPLPQALRVCSYQMQITLRTLLAGVLTPQDPSRFFFSPLTSSFCNARRSSQPLPVSPPCDLGCAGRWMEGRHRSNPNLVPAALRTQKLRLFCSLAAETPSPEECRALTPNCILKGKLEIAFGLEQLRFSWRSGKGDGSRQSQSMAH